MKETQRFHVECSCRLIDHSIYMEHDTKHDELYIFYYMAPNAGFFKRVWNALRYVFLCRAELGHFAETVLFRDGINRLIQYTETLHKWETPDVNS